MPKPARWIVVACSLVVWGCGPGGLASDGGFGDGGSGTTDDEPGEPSTSGMSEPSDPTSSSDTADTDTDTDTDTGAADDWTDPDPDMSTDIPDPIDAECTRVWTVLDSDKSHGHIGATPIGPGPGGGFVSVNPVLASQDAVNVDAWIRSWSPSGELSWEAQLSWGQHRDDPLALLSDELGDVLMSGRINANTFEDAMVAKLDGQVGDLVWTFLRGEAGGYSSIAYNGAALVVSGMIGAFGARRLEVLALEPETGEVLWSSELEVGEVGETRGLVVGPGTIDVLVSGALGQSFVEVLRFEPPALAPVILAELESGPEGIAVFDLEARDDDTLAAVYSVGAGSIVALIDRTTGVVIGSRWIDSFPDASTVVASELVPLPGGQGLGVAGTLEVGSEKQTFVLRLDSGLHDVCSGRLSKQDLGVSRSPLLRGLVVGDDGSLYTGSFVDTPLRLGAFARWD